MSWHDQREINTSGLCMAIALKQPLGLWDFYDSDEIEGPTHALHYSLSNAITISLPNEDYGTSARVRVAERISGCTIMNPFWNFHNGKFVFPESRKDDYLCVLARIIKDNSEIFSLLEMPAQEAVIEAYELADRV